jgi:uncharacterized protein YecT (DUF1311 family)
MTQIISALLVLLPLAAAAQSGGLPYSDAYKTCQEHAAASGVYPCIVAERTMWEKRLTKVYQELITKFDATDKAYPPDPAGHTPTRIMLLRAAERAWIVFRDADCAMSHSEVSWDPGGRTEGLFVAICGLDRVIARTVELEELAKEE